jgi:hypothetical protein
LSVDQQEVQHTDDHHLGEQSIKRESSPRPDPERGQNDPEKECKGRLLRRTGDPAEQRDYRSGRRDANQHRSQGETRGKELQWDLYHRARPQFDMTFRL